MASGRVGGIMIIEHEKVEPKIWRLETWPEVLYNVGDRVECRAEPDVEKYKLQTIIFRVRDRHFKSYGERTFGLVLYVDIVEEGPL